MTYRVERYNDVDELETIWKETVVANSIYYTVIYLEGLRRTMKRLSQVSRCSRQDSKRTPPEYESRMYPVSSTIAKLAGESEGPDTRQLHQDPVQGTPGVSAPQVLPFREAN